MGPFEVFAYGPTLKFKLSWSGTPLSRPPRRPTSLPLRAPLTSENAASTNDVRMPNGEANGNSESRKKQRVFYQFIYNNNTRQQTEAREDFYCPWCSIDCRRLYSLLKHLKLCHRRFIFTYAVSMLIVKALLHRLFLSRNSMQCLSRCSCNFKIGRVNQLRFHRDCGVVCQCTSIL